VWLPTFTFSGGAKSREPTHSGSLLPDWEGTKACGAAGAAGAATSGALTGAGGATGFSSQAEAKERERAARVASAEWRVTEHLPALGG